MVRIMNVTLWLAVVLGLTAAKRYGEPQQRSSNISDSILSPERLNETIYEDFDHDSTDVFKRDDVEAVWFKALCSGQKLYQAMITNVDIAAKFITPVTSPFDGDMLEASKAWGWNDDSEDYDDDCDFADVISYDLERAFGALEIDTRSVGMEGSDRCFHLDHQDGPTVIKLPDGKLPKPIDQKYTGPDGIQRRVTGGWATIGVNDASGVLYFINRQSPYTNAKHLWTDRPNDNPKPDELPLLRSSSDIAWGLWNRGNAANVKNIQKIFSMNVINEETSIIIYRALGNVKVPAGKPPLSRVEKWPGNTFVVGTDNDDGLALLGSPNGVGAGYFLAQHKAQLGGNKFVERITVFCNDHYGSPQLLFWIADKPAEEPKKPDDPKDKGPGGMVERRIVKSRNDGRELVREHVFKVRL